MSRARRIFGRSVSVVHFEVLMVTKAKQVRWFLAAVLWPGFWFGSNASQVEAARVELQLGSAAEDMRYDTDQDRTCDTFWHDGEYLEILASGVGRAMCAAIGFDLRANAHDATINGATLRLITDCGSAASGVIHVDGTAFVGSWLRSADGCVGFMFENAERAEGWKEGFVYSRTSGEVAQRPGLVVACAAAKLPPAALGAIPIFCYLLMRRPARSPGGRRA